MIRTSRPLIAVLTGLVLSLGAAPLAQAASATAQPAASVAVSDAARISVAAGLDDARGRATRSVGAAVFWSSAPFGARDNWRWRLGGMISADQDYWLGGGVSFEHRFGPGPWYLEAGFQPGIYSRGDAPTGVDPVTSPSFLSHLALGYVLESGADVSLSLSHRSSGRIDSGQSISEELMVRYALPF